MGSWREQSGIGDDPDDCLGHLLGHACVKRQTQNLAPDPTGCRQWIAGRRQVMVARHVANQRMEIAPGQNILLQEPLIYPVPVNRMLIVNEHWEI